MKRCGQFAPSLLERIGNEGARKILANLAALLCARVTEEARTTLERLRMKTMDR